MYFKIFILACFVADIYSDDSVIAPTDLQGRIIGGKDAFPGQFPYMASIQKLISNDKYSHSCGGAILNERWILTATHCVSDGDPGNRVVVKVGKHHIREDEPSEQVAKIKKYFKYRSINSTSADDIALLQLRTPLKLNERVAKIALPEKDSDPDGMSTLAGWGRSTERPGMPATPILQYTDLPLIDRESCLKAVKKLNDDYDVPVTNICTMTTEPTAGCFGDSGSPLTRRNDRGEVEVIGVFAWTFPCEDFGSPQGFVRVSVFIDWIESTMKTNKC